MDTCIFVLGSLASEIDNITSPDFLPISWFGIVLEENADLYLRESSASVSQKVTNCPVIDRHSLAMLMNSFSTLQNPLGFRPFRLL